MEQIKLVVFWLDLLVVYTFFDEHNAFAPSLILTGVCSSVSFDYVTRQCLATFRSNANLRASHRVFSLRNDLSISSMHSIEGFSNSQILSRSSISHFSQQDDDCDVLDIKPMVASADEEGQQVRIWDVQTGRVLQSLANNGMGSIFDVKYYGGDILLGICGKDKFAVYRRPSAIC